MQDLVRRLCDAHTAVSRVVIVGKSCLHTRSSLQQHRKAHAAQHWNHRGGDAHSLLTWSALADDAHNLLGGREVFLLERGLSLVVLRRGLCTPTANAILVLLEQMMDSVQGMLGVAKEHSHIFFVKQRIVHPAITSGHRSLQDHTRLAVPDFDSRHAIDRTAHVILSRRVHDVVGSNNDCHIVGLQLRLNVLHLLDNVVGYISLC
mmetsp:Transcript_79380/g.164801  ORF Transcript_79380/g.164801 Transcript_79380/m.164801 type:complete len:205 (-) Transcript_79380:536-1150(-)